MIGVWENEKNKCWNCGNNSIWLWRRRHRYCELCEAVRVRACVFVSLINNLKWKDWEGKVTRVWQPKGTLSSGHFQGGSCQLKFNLWRRREKNKRNKFKIALNLQHFLHISHNWRVHVHKIADLTVSFARGFFQARGEATTSISSSCLPPPPPSVYLWPLAPEILRWREESFSDSRHTTG